ncbi:hypothetical protein BT67DRAFT_62515 [Trichocladium antarcticum]|uniref:Uncharacterized protein n=1 Tax=Trichocladium antarcticum TaxID=1450529 RepID=A0AAN6ZBD9_9PEZI|nr:hypothetical protein BT67DRAFT_62515 [Trichocladium antarcticum]
MSCYIVIPRFFLILCVFSRGAHVRLHVAGKRKRKRALRLTDDGGMCSGVVYVTELDCLLSGVTSLALLWELPCLGNLPTQLAATGKLGQGHQGVSRGNGTGKWRAVFQRNRRPWFHQRAKYRLPALKVQRGGQ